MGWNRISQRVGRQRNSSRIVIIADVFDALISQRPYKKEWSVEEATNYIEENSGTYFDPNLVALFKEILPDIIKIKTLFAEGPL
jgi:putative two-component system response regulator